MIAAALIFINPPKDLHWDGKLQTQMGGVDSEPAPSGSKGSMQTGTRQVA